jgi:hypothetical protein
MLCQAKHRAHSWACIGSEIGFDGQMHVAVPAIKLRAMGVTIELQNLSDTRLCRDITARIEHAFADRRGDWRVSIAGSRESENWEMRVEGPNGFERSYTLAGSAGEHAPEAIRKLILQLIPASSV